MKNLVLSVLKNSARYKLSRSSARVVGVTGSVGKSSAVYLLDAVLRSEFTTQATFSSNSESGLPLEILGTRSLLHDYSAWSWLKVLLSAPFAALAPFRPELFIAEMGIDSSRAPKNMQYLLDFIHPDIGVLLSVAPSHTQQFAEELGFDASDTDSLLTAIAREKGKILTSLPKTALAVAVIDSPYIQALLPHVQAELITISAQNNPSADGYITKYEIQESVTSFSGVLGGTNFNLKIPGYALSREYGGIILTVLAVALGLGVPVERASKNVVKNFTLPVGRMSLLEGKNKTTILDSSYNSSPAALKSVLETVQKMRGFSRKIGILGDMRELGPLEAAAHAELADSVTETFDSVVLVGPKMRDYLLPILQQRGFPVRWYETSLGTGTSLLQENFMRPGDLVLVKGSQNTIFLEQTVLEIMQQPERSKELLCRQEDHWFADRKKFWDASSASQT